MGCGMQVLELGKLSLELGIDAERRMLQREPDDCLLNLRCARFRRFGVWSADVALRLAKHKVRSIRDSL